MKSLQNISRLDQTDQLEVGYWLRHRKFIDWNRQINQNLTGQGLADLQTRLLTEQLKLNWSRPTNLADQGLANLQTRLLTEQLELNYPRPIRFLDWTRQNN